MNYEVFIPPANNEEGKRIMKQHKRIHRIDDRFIQSQVHKLVGSNTTPPLGEPTAFRKTDQLFTLDASHPSLTFN